MSDPDSIAAPETRLLKLWQRLGRNKPGRWLFSFLLARSVPYSGSIRPLVEAIAPGHAVVVLRDRRRVRNHLHSVHAIALANLGELASGLALLAALPSGVRGIVTGLEIEYLKKARGTLQAQGRVELPGMITAETAWLAHAEIMDEQSDVVARVKVFWRLGPREAPADEQT
jgi:acyl-coenzyme A thioesterase PaaI-like protein